MLYSYFSQNSGLGADYNKGRFPLYVVSKAGSQMAVDEASPAMFT
jgi:hypothetical protein